MKKNLEDLLIDELHDILSCEEQISEALPEMAAAAESTDLKKAFESHLKETKGQIKRLEKIFKLLDVEKEEKFCKATKGLIDECKEVLKDFKTKSPLRDAALISKAQRIEHYEISAYGTVRTFAKDLKLKEVAALLDETLNEEGNADKKLTKLAQGGFFSYGINHQANLDDEDTQTNSKSSKNNPSVSKKVATLKTTIVKKITPKKVLPKLDLSKKDCPKKSGTKEKSVASKVVKKATNKH